MKNGLVNYVGAMLKAANFESEKAGRQFVAAALIEEAMNLMHDEDKTINMFVSKPLFRATSILLRERAKEMEPHAGNKAIANCIVQYTTESDALSKIAESIKE